MRRWPYGFIIGIVIGVVLVRMILFILTGVY